MSEGMLICCGSLTLDNVLTADGRALPQSWGGNVLYSAAAARLWHDNVGIVSRIGHDYPAEVAERFVERGIDVSGLVPVDAPHGMNVAFSYRPDGSRVRKFPSEAVDLIPEADRARFIDYTTFGTEHRFATWMAFAPEGSDIPVSWRDRGLGLHCAAMPVERHISIARAMRPARKSGAWIQVDSPWYDERDLTRDYSADLFALIDALLPSEADLEIVAGSGSLAHQIDGMLASGLKRVVVKRGGEGCTLHTRGETDSHIPIYPSQVIDLTGAGDAFCGGFLAGMIMTGNPVEASHYGTVSASFAIEGVGISRLLKTTADEAQQRLAQYRDSIKVLPQT
ncbi:carbohydrate kinase family protein [Hoeflea sp. G2-23]|uniref:Carbohydrate kinase family protein n=1 Tax=Hoeflea algicola TaxID=2983763 RepID=A0ABT3Z9Y3_9HYPH|nr:carbohydrate kinase family protein [Hoeflea algicola]MCY0148595.1 carbohydrate kinase family protein [Hoeflea algicola]